MQTVDRSSQKAPRYGRIVLALAGKDIVDAFMNKTTLTVLIGVLFVMLTVQALPFILKFDDRPRVAIYDAARSGIADTLRNEGDVQLYELRSPDQAVSVAQESSGALIAIIMPEAWENETGPLLVDGYMAHWLRPQAAAELVASAEVALTAVTNRSITIETQPVYPTLASGGHTVMVSLGLVLGIIMITGVLVPHLLLEEKTTHTLDVLRVSPASVPQIIWGKGLAGMVYGILTAAVLLAFNISMVNQWGVMVLAILTGTLFGVMVGLFVGIITENEGTMQLWTGLLVVLLIFPSLIGFLTSRSLPPWALALTNWLPTSAMFTLFRQSFTDVWQPGQFALNLGVILAAVLLVYSLTVWRLRRWE